jgi:hypothetical protein
MSASKITVTEARALRDSAIDAIPVTASNAYRTARLATIAADYDRDFDAAIGA